MKFSSLFSRRRTTGSKCGENNLALSIEGVSKCFGKKEVDGFTVLDNIDLQIEKNKITAVIGSNGAGKTTLFNIISGFLEPDKGKLTYSGNGGPVVLNNLPPHKVSRKGIGRLFQDAHVFPNISIIDNMLIAGKTTASHETIFDAIFRRSPVKKNDRKEEEQALAIFKQLFNEGEDPFTYRKTHYANSLSFGQQRLLALLRLLMGRYDLLLLDEPTAGVNIEIIKKMAEIVRMMPTKGYSVILIEHNWEFVLEVADFCYFLDEGKVAAFGTPGDVLGNRKVRERYLGR